MPAKLRSVIQMSTVTPGNNETLRMGEMRVDAV
jgi:hypothetical protein